MVELILSSLLGAAGGGGVVGSLVILLLKRQIDRENEERKTLIEKSDDLAHRLESLEKEKLLRLENKLDKHLDEDKPGEVALALKHLSEALRENSSLQRENALQIARIDKNCGEMAQEIRSDKQWIANINEAVQKHITNGRIHRGN